MTGEFYIHVPQGRLMQMPYPDEIKVIKKPDFKIGFDGKCFFYDGVDGIATLIYYVIEDEEELDGWSAYRQMKYGDYWVVKGTEIIKEFTKEKPVIEDKPDNNWVDRYNCHTWTVTASPGTYVNTSTVTAWVNMSDIQPIQVYTPSWYYTARETE